MLPRCRRGGGWQHLTISGDGQRRAALALSRCTQLRLRQGGRGVPRCAPVRDPQVDEGLIDEADQNPSAHLGVIEAGAYSVRQGWKTSCGSSLVGWWAAESAGGFTSWKVD